MVGSKYIPKSYQKEIDELKKKLLDKEGEIEYLEDKIIQLEAMRGTSNDIKVSSGAALDYETIQRAADAAARQGFRTDSLELSQYSRGLSSAIEQQNAFGRASSTVGQTVSGSYHTLTASPWSTETVTWSISGSDTVSPRRR